MLGSVQLRRPYWRQKYPSLSFTNIMADVRRMECAHTPPAGTFRDLWLRRSRSISPAAADSRAHASLSPVTNEAKKANVSFHSRRKIGTSKDHYFGREEMKIINVLNYTQPQLKRERSLRKHATPTKNGISFLRRSAFGVCLVCSFLSLAPALRCLSNVFLD